eukprot:gnl/Spiro4/2155_TR1032_c0_g1_i1.p1 gnl/Spiro4/2155_TR1032_c0_g1~~gnl/Spiro4/2155_TR1032_c0_g1_i1.p1  ORF type:complete len:252 (-),score=48.61 gnl/Spiro4/2155_TR1032_c0_g1_i1:83-808(-)
MLGRVFSAFVRRVVPRSALPVRNFSAPAVSHEVIPLTSNIFHVPLGSRPRYEDNLSWLRDSKCTTVEPTRTLYIQSVIDNPVARRCQMVGEYPEMPISDNELVELERVKQIVWGLESNPEVVYEFMRNLILNPALRVYVIYHTLSLEDRIAYWLRIHVKIPEADFQHYFDVLRKNFVGPWQVKHVDKIIDREAAEREARNARKEQELLEKFAEDERKWNKNEELDARMNHLISQLQMRKNV